MLTKIIEFSLRNRLTIFIFTFAVIAFGIYSLSKIHIGAVPDVTNNQVQVITTSRNLSTEDIEQFITYPIELEMANLPGVVEIRSISKFGLSVVTIVFEDNMGTYLPRQLISEKILAISEKIPEGYGHPEMGPISTGLGEIYQYILDVEPGFESKYSVTDLRSIQDWIVKRQLSGIPGVIEVNTWGGFLKQYEVAINTEKLNAMNISASEVFTAVDMNNSIAGGAYIEKRDQAYFIRGEGLVKSLEDIRNIPVKNVDGLAIYIKDIAEVGFGHANRFGAITGNGEGEKVLGQVMMLKDGNSKKVIDDVKSRVDQISGILPEGIYINAFLERSELIERTSFTVAENLILGCLIVIFVVVLLLGNIRSGLVVASMIPMTLLFAISMMNIFGVDANLMSLGAIDFGIIIDGSVIIVEFISFQLVSKRDEILPLGLSQQKKRISEITSQAASKMMNSAIFGQLIILIVFIPILSLSGVEGKMFKPMALTFSFALIGAMIFGLTYIPVMSAIFIKPVKRTRPNLSQRIMTVISNMYQPTIRWALQFKRIVIGIAVVLLIVATFIFSRMGGEFVPTLDEGDFVIQPVLKTGTSLSKTIETTTKIEQILLENFPEVVQVVSRIGAAEIPTDPMSMEDSDIIIKLKPKREWVSARSKDELADKFKEALSIYFPEVELEFTQPIEMRFNELITGVRSDIAIKIFGDDLEILSQKANEISELISGVEGASDITVEKIEGLPQMKIEFDRHKIARYGLSIKEVNDVISMGFAGTVVGSVFEGEKRFDLAVRLDKDHRKDISNLEQLFIDTPLGLKVPLSELGSINYTKGPAKISRDNTKRRIVVAVNVRNRDLQSVIEDAQELISKEIKLPAGYSITYGGQFENLQRAKSRLKIAVPVALVLIFLMLFFAFGSVREATLIFSAIPLAAVGGVLLLKLRGMPFSISAGVGFIALFGIAVLNGIVLIEHFKELKSKGMEDINKIIINGATERLRPVILTALAAALGFLPMAVSTGAGAEVQRPLATVVIGGLVSSTLLTMIVLPVLYSLFNKSRKVKLDALKDPLPIIVIGLFSLSIHAQEVETLDLQSITNLALEGNSGLMASSLEVERADALVGNAFSFDKTELYYHYDENNLAYNNRAIKVFGIEQEFLFPTRYFADKKVNRLQLEMENNSYSIKRRQLELKINARYYQLQYEFEREAVLKKLDSFYTTFAYAAKRKFEIGDTNYLEKITAQAKQKQLQTLHRQSQQDVERAMILLKEAVQSDKEFKVAKIPLNKLELNEPEFEENPGLIYFSKRKEFVQAKKNVESQSLLPDIKINYFLGSNPGLDENLTGYQIGLKIPILFSGNAAKIKASKIETEILENLEADYRIQLETKHSEMITELQKYQEALTYYQSEGENLSREIFKTAQFSYESGEINFFQYIQSMENALGILLDYLGNLNDYNQLVLEINYLTL
ncbi:CusA/CzcA family heavy metal efflux RND transporter [Lutimonas zeaxanthinifaciens]|uniref:CusA/CzcA family heavy metal efflux RND transporter n=1 Tax=Lutimonas zeaxanthinifaciens TaxID=3060215 RepID=UPI00265D20CB|nr:CusA/CzcA family heavy metal efflux RND transporter [Lutimonas sp. YSD2104]WKK64630.1 CusA/CzcA family heavy metal efflux RND transporter [Lutimonas sp. YSD2104]